MNTILLTSKKLIKKLLRYPTYIHPTIVNEAVNFEKQLIFIAIPKTGTTSVRNQISPEGSALIPNPHLSIIQIRDALYVYFLINALGKNQTFPTKVTSQDADIRLQATNTFNKFFKFSAVRNPWARAVSLYYRREGVRVKNNMSFDEFCDKHIYASDTCFHPTLHKNQLDWLCDENEHIIVDYVYKIEDFKNAIREIEERTSGRLKLTWGEANKNPSSQAKSYKELYNEKTKKLIAKRFEKDVDYFKYSF